jgi:hypothetical protein
VIDPALYEALIGEPFPTMCSPEGPGDATHGGLVLVGLPADQCVARALGARAMPGAWPPGAPTACPRDGIGEVCDGGEYKTVCALGFMRPYDGPRLEMWFGKGAKR